MGAQPRRRGELTAVSLPVRPTPLPFPRPTAPHYPLARRDRYGSALNSLCLTGFLGGYTTFSSMQLDAVKLTGTSGSLSAGFYLLLSVALGQVAAWLGGALARTQA